MAENDAVAPYEVAVDEARRMLRVTLRGFWDRAIVERYLADLGAASAQVSRRGRSWWLIDMAHSQVQSREVTGLMSDKLPALFPREVTVAVVVDASLPAVQARRVASNDHHRHFSTTVEAERWLREQGMPA